jgi:hypothetical protein
MASVQVHGSRYLNDRIIIPGVQKQIVTLKEYPSAYFYIEGLDSPAYKNSQISKMNDILTGDELTEDGVYTWIIGTKMNLNTIEEQENLESCDTDKLYIWLLQSISEQEIGSKHYDIMLKLQSRLEQLNSDITDEERKMIETDGIIDELFFAGELRKEGNNITVNLLSGSYMADVIDATNIPDDKKDCIERVLRTRIEDEEHSFNIIFDESARTLINTPINLSTLINYAHAGVKVYMFNDRNDIVKYSRSGIEIAKLSNQKKTAERLLSNPRIKDDPKRIKQLNEQVNDINEKIHNIIEFNESIKPLTFEELNSLYLKGGKKKRTLKSRKSIKNKGKKSIKNKGKKSIKNKGKKSIKNKGKKSIKNKGKKTIKNKGKKI